MKTAQFIRQLQERWKTLKKSVRWCLGEGEWMDVTNTAGVLGRLRWKCNGTHAETRFRLPAKRTSPFKSAGASVQSTTVSRVVRISGSNAGYTVFRGSVKSTGYPLHSPVSPSFPLPCVTACHHISTGLYQLWIYIFYHARTRLV